LKTSKLFITALFRWNLSTSAVITNKDRQIWIHCMRFEVLMVVKMLMLVFWIVMLCGLVGRYQCFGGTFCFHLRASVCSSERLVCTYESTQHNYPEDQHPQEYIVSPQKWLCQKHSALRSLVLKS
jgi:hypothetical protein